MMKRATSDAGPWGGWARWQAGLAVLLMFGAILTVMPDRARSHNNPTFKEVLLLTIEVTAEPVADQSFKAYSEPFDLNLPKKTIELVWRVKGGASSEITFAVAKGDKLHASELVDGAKSRILKGGDIRIVNLEGTASPFQIEIYANVIDRSK